MAYSLAIRSRAETLRSIAFGSISGTYMPVGTAFAHPLRVLKFVNDTNVTILVSYDGIVDHDVMQSGAGQIYDITANKTREQGFYAAEGDRVYVKYASGAPIIGNFYVVAYYGSEQ